MKVAVIEIKLWVKKWVENYLNEIKPCLKDMISNPHKIWYVENSINSNN